MDTRLRVYIPYILTSMYINILHPHFSKLFPSFIKFSYDGGPIDVLPVTVVEDNDG